MRVTTQVNTASLTAPPARPPSNTIIDNNTIGLSSANTNESLAPPTQPLVLPTQPPSNTIINNNAIGLLFANTINNNTIGLSSANVNDSFHKDFNSASNPFTIDLSVAKTSKNTLTNLQSTHHPNVATIDMHQNPYNEEKI